MILGEIDAFLSLWDRFRSLLVREPRAKNSGDTVSSRFVRLFEAHGVHRNQIPRFFGYNLTLANMKDDETLLAALTEETLYAAAALFAVQREWLDCASEQIYPLHDFYKKPDEFICFLDRLLATPEHDVHGVLLVAEPESHEIDTLLILEERIGSVGEKEICRYHICDNWMFGYWKARAYLAACVASAWKRNVCILGRRVDINLIRRYRDGEAFLEYRYDSALPTEGKHWYPEDMALEPSAFLDGLGEERFGEEHGLELWLRLHEQGFMSTGLPPVNVRDAFVVKLAEVRAG